MRRFVRGCLKSLLALSILGVCTAFVGLVIGNDSVFWAGLFLAAPLYLCYVLPMTVLLVGIFVVAAIAVIADTSGIGRR